MFVGPDSRKNMANVSQSAPKDMSLTTNTNRSVSRPAMNTTPTTMNTRMPVFLVERILFGSHHGKSADVSEDSKRFTTSAFQSAQLELSDTDTLVSKTVPNILPMSQNGKNVSVTRDILETNTEIVFQTVENMKNTITMLTNVFARKV